MVARWWWWWWHVADANYVNVFLLTYHSWATSAELLDSMTHLYLELSNQNDQNKVALMRYHFPLSILHFSRLSTGATSKWNS